MNNSVRKGLKSTFAPTNSSTFSISGSDSSTIWATCSLMHTGSINVPTASPANLIRCSTTNPSRTTTRFASVLRSNVRTNMWCLVFDAALMAATSCDRQNSTKRVLTSIGFKLVPAKSASLAFTNATIAPSRSTGSSSSDVAGSTSSSAGMERAAKCSSGGPSSSVLSVDRCDTSPSTSGSVAVPVDRSALASIFRFRSRCLTHAIDDVSKRLSTDGATPAPTPICVFSVVVIIVHIIVSLSPSNVSHPTSSHLLKPASHMAALIAFSVSSMESHGSTTRISDPRG